MDPNEPTVKPAWTTTEFWLSVIPVILLIVKMFTGEDTTGIDVAGLAALAAGIVTAGYAISRALQKKAVIIAKANLEGARMQIAYSQQANLAAQDHEKVMSVNRTLAEQLDARIAALEAKAA